MAASSLQLEALLRSQQETGLQQSNSIDALEAEQRRLIEGKDNISAALDKQLKEYQDVLVALDKKREKKQNYKKHLQELDIQHKDVVFKLERMSEKCAVQEHVIEKAAVRQEELQVQLGRAGRSVPHAEDSRSQLVE